MKHWKVILTLLGLLLVGAPPLQAADSNEVVLVNHVIVRFRVGYAGKTVMERWQITNQRLTKIMNTQRDLGPEHVSVRRINKAPAVYLNGKLLVTATAADARANGASAQSLANTWAGNLRRALQAKRNLAAG